MGYEEFRDKILRRQSRKNFKVSNSWGVYDCYKHIRKNHWYNIGRPLKEQEFYAIIRGINELLAEELSNGNEVVFPYKMGKLEIRKLQVGVSLVDGKLKNTYPIDWKETIKLWYEDKEAHMNKTLVRNTKGVVFYIKYTKFGATYENQCFYEFVVNRFLKKALQKNVKKGKIETLW